MTNYNICSKWEKLRNEQSLSYPNVENNSKHVCKMHKKNVKIYRKTLAQRWYLNKPVNERKMNFKPKKYTKPHMMNIQLKIINCWWIWIREFTNELENERLLTLKISGIGLSFRWTRQCTFKNANRAWLEYVKWCARCWFCGGTAVASTQRYESYEHGKWRRRNWNSYSELSLELMIEMTQNKRGLMTSTIHCK